MRVVVAAEAKVDAAHERHVPAGCAGVTEDDEFLMMAACPAGAGIEKHLAAVLVDPPDELRVGLLGLPQRLGVRAQAPDAEPR
jgi:hypothetical protein